MTDNVWHILDVIPNSPADTAGLLPYGDYIVGTPEGDLHGEAGLSELVEDFLGRDLRVYVYNHEFAVTRIVTIIPSRSWGGSGALGCVLGFGALHRLPVPMIEPIAGPGETLFETAGLGNEERRRPSPHIPTQQAYPSTADNQSADLWTPASMTSPPPQAQPATSPGTKGPPRGGRKPRPVPAAAKIAFDDYFNEGEQKSREEDFAPSSKNAPPPPPPKSAALPKPKSPEAEIPGDEGKASESGEEHPETESPGG